MESFILHIDTASEKGLVMLSRAGNPIAYRFNDKATEHAAFVQPAIAGLMAETGITQIDIICIAVANGPGSYTGLRVGLAAAKGLCFAWKKPLITLSSLKILAAAMKHSLQHSPFTSEVEIIYVPLIDARRMEVFRAVYLHKNLEALVDPGAEILTPGFLAPFLETRKLAFSGTGAAKWKNICPSPNAIFMEEPEKNNAFATLAYEAAITKQWADLVYSEPFYAKEFYHMTKST